MSFLFCLWWWSGRAREHTPRTRHSIADENLLVRAHRVQSPACTELSTEAFCYFPPLSLVCFKFGQACLGWKHDHALGSPLFRLFVFSSVRQSSVLTKLLRRPVKHLPGAAEPFVSGMQEFPASQWWTMGTGNDPCEMSGLQQRVSMMSHNIRTHA